MVMGSVKTIKPYSSDGNPGCFTGDLSAITGTTATIVVVHGAGQCRDSDHDDLGVVFNGSEPVMWTCLSAAEIAKFHAWGRSSFPGARTLDVTTALADVNCPPPSSSAQVQRDAAAQMRALLTSLAAIWLAATTAPAVPKPAA
jgi:hypothetical protein